MGLPTTEEISIMTPMMRQFFELKARAEDTILFFRMGDFYEIFGDDALEVAPKLELVLTSRERGDKQKIPFCGVPHHSARNYWLKLLKMGYRIALADQVENPEEAKGLVKRDIVQIFTPGCVDDLDGLEFDQPNYILAAYEDPKSRTWAAALIDISTGEFRSGEVEDILEVKALVNRYRPKEILIRRFVKDEIQGLLAGYCQEAQLSFADLSEAILRDEKSQTDLFLEVFGQEELEYFPCGRIRGGKALVASVLFYLKSLRASLLQFMTIRPLVDCDVMILDETAMRDLELFETVRRRQSEGSLFREINETETPMGARYLRASLIAPFIQEEQIIRRQNGTAALLAQNNLLIKLKDHLKGCPDLERISTRVLNGKASPMELSYLREVLRKTHQLSEVLADSPLNPFEQFSEIVEQLRLSAKPLALLERFLKEQPSNLGTDLEVICEGFDSQFDQMRDLSKNGQDRLLAYEKKLRDETGINSLKIKQHKTFGLLIEVTKANLSRIPDYFIRRQTMVNNERFVTEDLMELDQVLSSATEQAVQKELLIYQKLLSQLSEFKGEYSRVANGLAQLDLLQSLAWKAKEDHYHRPSMSLSGRIIIKGGRHPVVERFVSRSQFMPNDLVMKDDVKHLLITGPNMAGKSTVMRQTAIIAILHQIGSFVPALEVELPIFDRIFTRVGASDDLSRGQSTFMVEMSEAAHILRQASHRSLVILDEVGRGTSTQDGMAIASAILESLAKNIGCYTLFATHYHELVPLADDLPNVAKIQTEVIEEKGSIRFTHRLIEGASGSSFGLEVARLAGIPQVVLDRANFYLSKQLESEAHYTAKNTCQSKLSRLNPTSPDRVEKLIRDKKVDEEHVATPLEALGLSCVSHNDELAQSFAAHVLDRLKKVNIHKTTPLQALNILDELKALSEKGEQPGLFEDLTH